MSARRWFLDTNVLVYLFDHDEPRKKAVAEGILSDPSAQICLSTQVLQEFYVTVTRKLGRPMPPEQALIAVEQFQLFPVSVVSNPLVIAAIRRGIDSRISFWDALIVETALAEKADVLVTEDLQDGWQIGSMRVWNPFKSPAEDSSPC